MGVTIKFFRPDPSAREDHCYVSEERQGKIVSASRGDAEFQAALGDTGGTVVDVYAVEGIDNSWLAVVGGQKHKVAGVQPLPPYFVFQRITLDHDDDLIIREAVELTAGGETLTDAQGNVLTACEDL